MSCIFCRIASGDLPSSMVWQGEKVLGFLDISPINPGHTLIIPRDHYASLTAVPDSVLAEMMILAPRLGKALMRELKCDGFNLHLANGACAGQVVFHVHLHVIPRFPTDGFSWGWRGLSLPESEQGSELAQALNARLQSNVQEQD